MLLSVPMHRVVHALRSPLGTMRHDYDLTFAVVPPLFSFPIFECQLCIERHRSSALFNPDAAAYPAAGGLAGWVLVLCLVCQQNPLIMASRNGPLCVTKQFTREQDISEQADKCSRLLVCASKGSKDSSSPSVKVPVGPGALLHPQIEVMCSAWRWLVGWY